MTGDRHDVGEALVKSLQNTKYSVDEKLEKSFITLFGQKPNILSEARNDANDIHEAEERNRKIEPSEQDQSRQSIEADVSGEESDSEDLHSLGSSDQDEAAQKDAMIDSEFGSSVKESDQRATLKGHMKEHVEFHGGRLRRKAVFGNDDDNNLKVKRESHYVS